MSFLMAQRTRSMAAVLTVGVVLGALLVGLIVGFATMKYSGPVTSRA